MTAALQSRVRAAKRARQSQRIRESTIHRQVAEFLDAALPRGAWWSTFPAGGGGRVRGAQLKARGLKTGVPDILVIWNGEVRWIEIKSPRGHLSPEQVHTKADLEDAGCRVALCRNVAEVETYLKFYCQIPLKAKVAA